jgi:hypothetical protein
MRFGLGAFGLGFIVLASALSVASPCPAAPQTDSQRALALGYEGDGLFERKDWDAAYERFKQADALAHSPVFVLYMARCRRNAGRLIEAAAIYAKITAEPLGTNAPKPFRDALKDASTELAEVRSKIPSVVVEVTGRPAAEIEVRIDGRVVQRSERIEVDPGSHAILVTAPSAEAKREIEVQAGSGTTTVKLELPKKTAGEGDPTKPTEARGSIVPGVVTLSLAAVGFELGAITGGLAASDASAVKENCVDERCLASDADRLDRSRLLGNISTAGFIFGGVSLVTGIVLIAVRPGGTAAPAVTVGPSGVGVFGTF